MDQDIGEESISVEDATEESVWQAHWSAHYQQVVAGTYTLQERLMRLGVLGDLSTPAGLVASLRYLILPQ